MSVSAPLPVESGASEHNSFSATGALMLVRQSGHSTDSKSNSSSTLFGRTSDRRGFLHLAPAQLYAQLSIDNPQRRKDKWCTHVPNTRARKRREHRPFWTKRKVRQARPQLLSTGAPTSPRSPSIAAPPTDVALDERTRFSFF